MKRFFQILLINLFFLGLLLLPLELIYGQWFSSNAFDRLQILKDVSFNMDISELYPDSQTHIRYIRDAQGFRGVQKTIAEIDILTLGGSTTDQRYIDEEKTWQEVLQSQFDGKVEVANAGIDGQSAVGILSNFNLWFPNFSELKPKIVLIYTGINDLFTSANTNQDDITGTATWKSIIKSRSAIYRLLQKIRGTYQAKFKFPLSHRKINFQSIQWTNESLLQNHHSILSNRILQYRLRLREINIKIKSLGAEPVFVTQPNHFYRMQNGQKLGTSESMRWGENSINGLDAAILLDLMNQATLEECKSLKITCFDLAKDVSFEENDFYDYVHNTPSGAAKIGLYLANHLKNLVHTP